MMDRVTSPLVVTGAIWATATGIVEAADIPWSVILPGIAAIIASVGTLIREIRLYRKGQRKDATPGDDDKGTKRTTTAE